MSEGPTKQQEEALKQLSGYVLERLGEGVSQGDVAVELSNMVDWSFEDRERFVKAVREKALQVLRSTPQGKAAIASAWRTRMVRGFLIMAAGGLLTGIGYTLAHGGGFFLVFWGAIVFGAYDFIRGFFGWLSNQ